METLEFISNTDDIERSIKSFNDGISANAELAISICKTVRYWVYHEKLMQFGPGKYVGFKRMTYDIYRDARKDEYAGDLFDGGRTRTVIGDVVGRPFESDAKLSRLLAGYLTNLFGQDFLNNINTSKWKFLAIGETPNYWALVADPTIYDIEKAIKELEVDHWTSKKSDIRRGDKCIIWKAKRNTNNRGIVAFADVLSDPVVRDDTPEAKKYWKITPATERAKRVEVKYIVPENLPLWVEDDQSGVLKTLSVAKAKGGTVFKITPEQWSQVISITSGANKRSGLIINSALLKKVGSSQHTDGVRIDKEFHEIFNPHKSTEYVARGEARRVQVEFNGKTFDADYRFEGTKAEERDLQRIQFTRELKEEFKKVFPNAQGFFTIKLGRDLNHFLFSYDVQGTQEYSDKLEEGIERARKDTRQARQARLKKAQQRPDTVQVTAIAYIRNPDVIVEVLERAGGICEHCTKDAPFIRRRDGTPYLEVHHRIPLSEGGLDTVENAIAVCPNCHRELHYG